ncbi:sulfite exporter TauE/SafE family protein [Tateyamaria pelophila]|uniref:sulfite exporter TauE/SafE family protein n=1 Tax=Tateyamaria pelophila TaxID=328415 RepID=UPI001CBC834F|nr:sulfite exporter TauE/SafE family protein [Tateyamaria pelophila]
MPDIYLLLQMFVLLCVIGAIAGILAGLLGVGGGVVLVLAFFYAFQSLGYDNPQLMQMCLATSLATIIVTSVRSVLSHNKKGAVEWDILKTWAPGIAVGAVLGVLLVAQLRSTTLQIIFGVLAFLVGIYMAFGRSSWRLGETMPVGLARTVFSPIVGFLSVLMGIGGGSFGVPLMTLYGVPIHRAVATAAGFGVLIAVPSVIGFLFLDVSEPVPPLTIGAVNLVAFGVIIAMTLMTTPIGVWLAHKMNPAPLKRVFATFLILVALNMLYKVISG